jgi:hypothetical protein
VVSKWRYLGHLGTKTILRSVGCVSMAFTVIAGMFAVFFVVDHFYPTLVNNDLTPGSQAAMIAGLTVFALIAMPVLRFIGLLFATAARMDPVVPLTRNTAADLPETESLVRASTEPPQQQETVLLRAAQSDAATPSQELLRPGVSGSSSLN